MNSKLAKKIELAFSDVEPPPLESFLDPIMYARADQEPVEFAREIYPCSDLSEIDRYKLGDILSSLTPEAYNYVIPRVLIYLLEDESGLDENFYPSFVNMIDMTLEDPVLQDAYPLSKKEHFRSQLTPSQREAIIAAYQFLAIHPFLDGSDFPIYQGAIDFLKKE